MKPHEIESLNPLQTFLLTLVRSGLTTPYDLYVKAKLGPGLTSPSLKRLEQGGLLVSTPGPRNRLRYAITPKGEFFLAESLKPGAAEYWQSGPADIFESLPRGIVLAWLSSGVEEARLGVARATERLRITAQKKQRELEGLQEDVRSFQEHDLRNSQPVALQFPIALIYRWLKAETDAARSRLEIEAIRHIDKLLYDIPADTKIR